MRKVVLSMMVSVDGYMEGKDPEYNWHHWDAEMALYMMEFFKTVDTFIYGRRSYEAMIAYWPVLNDEFANVMNQTKKIVFSRTLKEVTWNSKLIKNNAVKEIQYLKKEEGKNLVLFGGADLAETLIENNLVDEFRLIVNPCLLGSGKPLFKNGSAIKSLKLTDTIKFDCGNVILIYSLNHSWL
ncbi:MAG TPA: dihydrofolate reductase family protein [Cyclobacteriaceae bacterium]